MVAPFSVEETPAQKTLFTSGIPLGFATEAADGGPQTAVYLPPGVAATSDRVNVVLWLHGHRDRNTTIKTYLEDPRFPFREILAQRHAPGSPAVVLVAPTLGPRDEPGTLGTNATGYLDRVKQAMVKALGFPPSLAWAEMVVACHSGGGKPTKQIASEVATMMDRDGGRLAEIWHFDSLYENDVQTPESPEPTAAWWAAWAASHPGTRITVYHLTTTEHAEYLRAACAAEGLDNVTVERSADPVHDTVARTYFPRCYDAWVASM